MNNYFLLDVLKESINTHLYNTLRKNTLRNNFFNDRFLRQVVGSKKYVIDLEGECISNSRYFGGFRNIVGISSYYFSHGYSSDERGILKKQFDSLDKIDENTNFSEIIKDKKILKKLNNLGYFKVNDILGKTYVEFLNASCGDQRIQDRANIRLWYVVASCLAGHGYVFAYDYENMGMITKGESKLYPRVVLGETECEKKEREDREKKQREEEQKLILGCDTCRSVEELQETLRKCREEKACLKTILSEKEKEIAFLQGQIASLYLKNDKLEIQIETLKRRNKTLHNELKTISSIVRKHTRI